MSEIATLIARRGQLKASLTRFWNYVQSSTRDVVQIEIRKIKVEEAWNEFQQVQSVIEDTGDAIKNENENFPYRDEFENLYFKAVAEAEKLVRGSERQQANTEMYGGMHNRNEVVDNSHTTAQPAIKLAPINVPVFSGKYEHWAAFQDIYMALIHTNKSLSAIQKFVYLRSSLSDNAIRCIQSLETTESNYEHAWTTLISRYSNKKVLVQTHVRNIVDLRPLNDNSADKLRQFMDTLISNMQALETLGEKPNEWGPLLLHLLHAKLDEETLRMWETQSTKDRVPPVNVLIEFLKERFQILESIESSQKRNKIVSSTSVRTNQFKTANFKGHMTRSTVMAMTNILKCYVCDQAHTIYKCPYFVALSITERISKINELKLCKVCLRKHEGRKCSLRNCLKCAKPHNTMLHISQITENNEREKSEMISTNTVPTTSTSTTAHESDNSDNVLLATAIVQVIGPSGKTALARVLLDSASMNNFISTDLVHNLGLKRTKINHTVCGIGSVKQNITSSVLVKVKSRINEYQLNLKSLVVPKITENLPTKMITEYYTRPDDIILADPSYNIPQKIDILIGAGHFFDIIGPRQYKAISDGPVYQDTSFGFIVSGVIQKSRDNVKSKSYYSTDTDNGFLTSTDNNDIGIRNDVKIKDLLQRLWEIEEINKPAYTREECECESYFGSTVTRNEHGRFIVHLPFRDNVAQIGKSYETAKRRLLSMEKRLQVNNSVRAEYVNFMQEYITLGHMELVNENEGEITGKTCYLPHHAVVKESSTSTRLRVVFDASCKTQTGVSLNDVLLKGPVIQDDLIYILARFRMHNYVITADIEKMYRQILVANEHRDYQRVLWRVDPQSPIQTYRLNTVTYGTVPASYLATGCLNVLANTVNEQYPEVASAINRDFYIDDFLGGADTKIEAIKLLNGLIDVMKGAGMKLRKWSSNDVEIIQSLPTEDIEMTNCHEVDSSVKKILGLFWESDTDVLKFKVQRTYEVDKNSITKRKMLADAASIFDPLGLVGPIVIRAKIMLQKLWHERIDWDEPIPSKVRDEWYAYQSCLPMLNNLSIPRKIVNNVRNVEIEIHGFADASEIAYGCCLYARCVDNTGLYIIKLLCAKSKVAPLKSLSLPRLELCAALLLARLAYKFVPKLHINIKRRYFWTDSKIVLAWISSPSIKWKTFVAHRVSEIQNKTLCTEWRHVSTRDNPADIISRGCCPSKIAETTIWWNGPQWLQEDEANWSIGSVINTDSILDGAPERKTETVHSLFIADQVIELCDKYSSLTKCLRITAYCLRFKNNVLRNRIKLTGALDAREIDNARLLLIKMIQKGSFEDELRGLNQGSGVPTKSKMFRLRPFLDNDGIIRVGGRLKNAMAIDVYQRHPIVLPGDSSFTYSLFREQHVQLMHSGPQALLAAIRLRYWPINGRNIARKVTHSCVICFRTKPTVVQPIMGDLPGDRVEPGRAFLKCGIDFAGPFLIKSSLVRKSPIIKAYACIFVCFITKAVHIEPVGDLTTNAFMNALNRFFDRRGKSSDIYSDNATNFVGANRRLHEIYKLFREEQVQKEVQERLANMGVRWHFIPPNSPHFGGLWEAAVKSMKILLGRVLGEAHLTFEEICTILTRAEACLNSRPITMLSSDPVDPAPLTPGHFLIGDSLSAVPEEDVSTVPVNRLTRWRRVTQYSQHLWQRWSREYLGQLQTRTKWAKEKGPRLGVNTVVVIKEDHSPPLQWRLGRVTAVYSGSDGVVRAAEVQTASGSYRRAVRLLCPLPFENNTH